MKKPDLGSIKPTCGQCDHWQHIEDDGGECCAMPSVPATEYDEGGDPVLVFIRPSMAADEWACIHFRGKN